MCSVVDTRALIVSETNEQFKIMQATNYQQKSFLIHSPFLLLLHKTFLFGHHFVHIFCLLHHIGFCWFYTYTSPKVTRFTESVRVYFCEGAWLCVGHNYKPILTSPCNLNPKLTKGNTNQAQTNDPLRSGCEPQTVPSKQFFCLVSHYTPTPPSSHRPPLFTSKVIYSQAEIDIKLRV